eukprot:Plantae.Rhodophyta-Hildenbrandia_rubra.ctg17685.p1 GENE.Plantae.Rhodophyta-Hildenbrandia_rubra.ctg17685~~Plantae.Rhodophyta-Hildenbrandia_rubra.ctg17685.p1  ORF type:complete len:1190 (+),score=214.78 Plantae.Rhodophyta-Hildenbrandia_rubra.ctg17685:7762-11331(+)
MILMARTYPKNHPPPTLTSSYLSATSEYGRQWRLRVLTPLAPNVALVENDPTATPSDTIIKNYVVKRVPYSSDAELSLLREEADKWTKLSTGGDLSNADSVNSFRTTVHDVVPLIDFFIFDQSQKPAVVFLMSYLPSQQLRLQRSEEEVFRLLFKLTTTLEALERANFPFHGNITQRTVLLDGDGRPKLGGFGLTRAKREGGITSDLRGLAEVAEASLEPSQKGVSPELGKILTLLKAEKPDLVTIRYQIAAARGLVPEMDISSLSERSSADGKTMDKSILVQNNENDPVQTIGKPAHDGRAPRGKKRKQKPRKTITSTPNREAGYDEESPNEAIDTLAECKDASKIQDEKKESNDVIILNGVSARSSQVLSSEESLPPAERGTGEDLRYINGSMTEGVASLSLDVSKVEREDVNGAKDLLSRYPHGSKDALEAVVGQVTGKGVEDSWVPYLNWMLEEIESRIQALKETFRALHRRPILKNPVIAFKTVLLVHSLCPRDSKQALQRMKEQDAFLGWISRSWTSSEVQRKKVTKKRPFMSCLLEGDISMYADSLRSSDAKEPSAEAMYNLLKVFVGAQDECKMIKYVAIPFLLRDLVNTEFSVEASTLVCSRQDVTNALDKQLLRRFGLELILESGKKSKASRTKRKRKQRDPGPHGEEEPVRPDSQDEYVSLDEQDAREQAVIEVAGAGTAGEGIGMSTSQDEIIIAQRSRSDIDMNGHGEPVIGKIIVGEHVGSRTGKSRKRDKTSKGKKKHRSREKKSKRAASKIINKLLVAGELGNSTSEDEASNSRPSISLQSAGKIVSGRGYSPGLEPETVEIVNIQESDAIPVVSHIGVIRESQIANSKPEEGTESGRASTSMKGIETPKPVDRNREKKKNGKSQTAGNERKAKKRGRERNTSTEPNYSVELKNAIATGRKTPSMNPAFEVMPHEVQLERQIGSGGFGVVYKGRFRGKIAAIKKVHAHALRNPACIAEFQSEVAVLCTLRHANILQFLGACSKPPNLMIITEFMSNGTLFDVLHRSQMKVTWSMRRKFALDICHGMRYLHSCKLLHRDLKSSNLMLDENYGCKVGDFGLTRISVSSNAAPMTGQCGTFQYMAPEVLGNRPYSEKADVFSFGILLWEMVDRRLPYFGMKPMQVALAVLNQGLRPQIPPNCPRPLRWLMERCWSQDPLRRPSFVDISTILEEMPE